MNDNFGADPSLVSAQTTPHCYDSAIWQFFWPLIHGGTTITGDLARVSSGEQMANFVSDYGVTMIDFVPSVLAEIVPQLLENKESVEKLSTLRHMIIGGEAIKPHAVKTFLSVLPGVRAWNLYGPTEASIGCVFFEVSGNEQGQRPSGVRSIKVDSVALSDRLSAETSAGASIDVVKSSLFSSSSASRQP